MDDVQGPTRPPGGRRRVLGAFAVTAVVCLTGLVAVAWVTGRPSAVVEVLPVPGGALPRHGGLPDGPATDCVEGYSVATLTHRAFAFDGTVVSVGDPVTETPGAAEAVGYLGATFVVHEWFRGGSGDRVTVDLLDHRWGLDGPAPWRVGTRLLVSGEPRWGGAPLDRAVAWPCGFVRYRDDETAADWRRAFAASR